jgi:mRNA interferase MazF
VVARRTPRAGDIVWIDFDPQVGREQAKRRPALVITDEGYNRASGLVVVCPFTSKRKPYPFALPAVIDSVEGAILVDQIKSFDWTARKVSLKSKGESVLLDHVRAYIGVLLGIK